jgi:L-aspartate oxidase
LTAAVTARAAGLRVIVVTKADPENGSTTWAQGGVAVVQKDNRDVGDSLEAHVADTLTAGAGLSEESAVRAIVEAGPAAIAALRARGAQFDLGAQGELARTREGGHSAFRVIHAGGDATGAEVERALLHATRADEVPLLTQHVVAQAVRTESGGVAGVLVLDHDNVPGVIQARAVVLATGGAGQLFAVTTNPEVATADGISLALLAGATVSDMEFMQFHPTVLYTGADARGRSPLITEAVRGEGAVLVDASGVRFMTDVHPLADLAPRDVVSAAMTARMRDTSVDHLFLDATHISAAHFRSRFPTVYGSCVEHGINPAAEPIPAAPAAHFYCGGVEATIDGRTSVPGLYAIGEVARSGLHGANRLASNSLLEGLVVGERVVAAIGQDIATGALPDPRESQQGWVPAAPIADRDQLQTRMSRTAGIGRIQEDLEKTATHITTSTVVRSLATRTAIEDAALTLVARTLLLSAMNRAETRGAHVRVDHPDRDPKWRRSQAIRLDAAGIPMIVGRS